MFDYTKTIINGVKTWCKSEIERLRIASDPLIAKAQKTADGAMNSVETLNSTMQTELGVIYQDINTAKNTANTAKNTAEAALPKSGGKMTGKLYLTGDPPETKNEAVSSGYVNALVDSARLWGDETSVTTTLTIDSEGGISSSYGTKTKSMYNISGYHLITGEEYTYKDYKGETSFTWGGDKEVLSVYQNNNVMMAYKKGKYEFSFVGVTSITLSGKFAKVPAISQPLFKCLPPYVVQTNLLLLSNNGTKLFEVTVDDSGTLSATEVTD